jgi:alpha-amylase/alpha-mannosidase (GH57 family)
MGQIAIHGHFYQPPREDPWTGEVPEQPGAAPFHDWNERITAECYRPNTQVEITTPDGPRVVNNFERISFDVGPTLMAWLERNDPATHDAIVAADRASTARLGHGNALAQAYHHSILPLQPLRDVRTEVRWGIADHRYRFGRDPEGMWLPECAANDDVLGVLIDEGIAFTILAPWQAYRWREPGGGWVNVADGWLDTRVAYRYLHPDGSGRELVLFFYDGDISRMIAFERLASCAEAFLAPFADAARPGGLVHVATDGETYGHHHRFSDLGLGYALYVEAERRGLEPTNYGAYLAEHPPRLEVEVVPGQGTSWSCAHGVGRWLRDCGCHTGGEPGWSQAWRYPLRRGLDVIRDAAGDAFAHLAPGLLTDPWGARDRYVDVVIGASALEDFLAREMTGDLGSAAVRRAADLLELQHRALQMYTSCGWFFNDVAGIETVQVLKYAARATELVESLGEPSPRAEALALLERARSNDPGAPSAAEIFNAALAR